MPVASDLLPEISIADIRDTLKAMMCDEVGSLSPNHLTGGQMLYDVFVPSIT
jgi:hypothetical protein